MVQKLIIKVPEPDQTDLSKRFADAGRSDVNTINNTLQIKDEWYNAAKEPVVRLLKQYNVKIDNLPQGVCLIAEIPDDTFEEVTKNISAIEGVEFKLI